MIANAIKLHPAGKDSYVPYVAMSGGTVIALATDKIHMGKDAFLGPIRHAIQRLSRRGFRSVEEREASGTRSTTKCC